MPNKIYDNNSGAVIFTLTHEEQKIKNLETEINETKKINQKLSDKIEETKKTNKQILDLLSEIDLNKLKSNSKTRISKTKKRDGE